MMPAALFQSALYASLVLCLAGLAWRVFAWFRAQALPQVGAASAAGGADAAPQRVASARFGRSAFRAAGTLLLDVLLQRRLFPETRRWTGHLLIVVGFVVLLLAHALAPLLTPGYQATLNPWLFLRNLCGAMALAGLALLLYGRMRHRARFPPPGRGANRIFMLLLAVVLLSGFLLESHKMASPRAFHRMTETFLGTADPDAVEPLQAFWAEEFGLRFPDRPVPLSRSQVEKGRRLHDESCAACHARPASAFASHALAQAFAPVSPALDRVRADAWLLYLHVFACFIGLASLPFTRFLHVVTAPIALLLDAAAHGRARSPDGRAVQRAFSLDACVGCGICDRHCSVASIARYLDNPALLPSHKLRHTAELRAGRDPTGSGADEALRRADGAYLCTDCGRCSSRCPLGLDLADLWEAGRADLAAAGLHAPAQWVRAQTALAWAEALERHRGTPAASMVDAACAPLCADRGRFSRCVQCQTCTNVCPVVACSIDAQRDVDLTPQKVMNLLRLGMGDLALGSRMVWDCASCYQCQENCPEGIRVTDILLELRALAVQRLGSVPRFGRAP